MYVKFGIVLASSNGDPPGSHHRPTLKEQDVTATEMSSHEQAVVSLLSNLSLSFDGAVLGLAIAGAAFRSILGFTSNASVLRKLRDAPSVGVSDLRSILWPDDPTESSGSGDSTSMSEPTEGRVVIVRGTVEAKSAVDGSWKSLKPNILTSQETGDEAVVIQRTQTVRVSPVISTS